MAEKESIRFRQPIMFIVWLFSIFCVISETHFYTSSTKVLDKVVYTYEHMVKYGDSVSLLLV